MSSIEMFLQPRQPIIAALSVHSLIGGKHIFRLFLEAATVNCFLSSLLAATPPPTVIVSSPRSRAAAIVFLVKLRATVA